ncbi:MAG: hypothetical protein ACR2NS_08755 [Gemmatimonadaceae bacterium]
MATDGIRRIQGGAAANFALAKFPDLSLYSNELEASLLARILNDLDKTRFRTQNGASSEAP